MGFLFFRILIDHMLMIVSKQQELLQDLSFLLFSYNTVTMNIPYSPKLLPERRLQQPALLFDTTVVSWCEWKLCVRRGSV